MFLDTRKATKYNTFLNISLFIFLIFYYEDIIGMYKVLKIFLIIMLSYVLNIYSLEKKKYTLENFLWSFIIFIPQVFMEYRAYFFDGGYKLISIIFIFQNMSKILFLKLISKKVDFLLIGEGEKKEIIKKIIENKPEFRIVGELEISEINKVEKLTKNLNVDNFIITEKIYDLDNAKLLMNFKLDGKGIYDYLSFFEEVEYKVPVNAIDENWILFGKGYAILRKDINFKIKRLMDVFCALIIGIITIPIMLISAVIIKLESKGTIIYKQKRVGMRNQEFEIYKFRSMFNDAEKNGAQWATERDKRATKFGNFMRKMRIDELPQLRNVLKGEMSFVGPRPERKVFIKELEKEIPFYNIRHSVKPGLTGWAQVKYPYGASVEDSHQKLQYDLYYIKNQTVMFDIMILFKTLKIVLSRVGR